MGQIRKPQPVKLIVSIFSQSPSLITTAQQHLQKHLGPIDYQSPLLDFTQTDYYRQEFGTGLKRQFIAFERLIDPGKLWKVKCFTNKLEAKFSNRGKRTLNLDPGIITEASLILASAKMFAHRVYIRDGIYQEVTLIYKDKTFWPLAWTYPDYKECIDIFVAIRTILHNQLKIKTNK